MTSNPSSERIPSSESIMVDSSSTIKTAGYIIKAPFYISCLKKKALTCGVAEIFAAGELFVQTRVVVQTLSAGSNFLALFILGLLDRQFNDKLGAVGLIVLDPNHAVMI